MTDKEKTKILKEFAKKITQNQKNMPPKYQKMASEHFWELVDFPQKEKK